MTLYADRPTMAARQLVTDLFVIAWVYAWVRVAMWLHDLVSTLAVPGRKLEGAGRGIAQNLAEAGGKVGRVPVVGDELTVPFNRAAEAALSVADAGRDQQELVADLALVLPIGLVALPFTLVLLGWLPLRARWVRRAAAAKAVRDRPAGRDLLALRALATRPLPELAKLGPDVAQAWRSGDESIVDALATLELHRLGLRPARR